MPKRFSRRGSSHIAGWLTPILIATSLALVAPSLSLAQTTTLNGNALTLRSTGSAVGTAWNLDRDGYLGTYITLSAPGNVTIDVQAQGIASGGIDPNMNVVIADAKAAFDVVPAAGTYSHTYSLPALSSSAPNSTMISAPRRANCASTTSKSPVPP